MSNRGFAGLNVWYGPWDKVLSECNFQSTFGPVWRNAPGVDGQTVKQFVEQGFCCRKSNVSRFIADQFRSVHRNGAIPILDRLQIETIEQIQEVQS